MPHLPIAHGFVQEVDILNEEAEEGDDTPPLLLLSCLGNGQS